MTIENLNVKIRYSERQSYLLCHILADGFHTFRNEVFVFDRKNNIFAFKIVNSN